MPKALASQDAYKRLLSGGGAKLPALPSPQAVSGHFGGGASWKYEALRPMMQSLAAMPSFREVFMANRGRAGGFVPDDSLRLLLTDLLKWRV